MSPHSTNRQSETYSLVPHEAADIFPMMDDDSLSSLAADIKKNGQRERIELLNGQILDGRNRYKACEIAEVEPRIRELDPDTVERAGGPVAYVLSKNLHRRHLTTSQRKKASERAIVLDPSLSDRRIAASTGTDHKTVNKIRRELESSGEIPHIERTTGRDGKKRPSTRKAGERTEKSSSKRDSPKSASTSPNAADDDLDGLLAILEMTCSPLPPKALTTVRRLLKQVREIVNKQPQVNLSALNEGMEQLHTLFVRHRDKQHVDPSDILRVHKTLRSVSPGVNGTAKR